jgi:hypothetical protein
VRPFKERNDCWRRIPESAPGSLRLGQGQIASTTQGRYRARKKVNVEGVAEAAWTSPKVDLMVTRRNWEIGGLIDAKAPNLDFVDHHAK